MSGRRIVCAVALVLAGSVAAPARATVTAVIPADQDGPNDAFLTNEILYATGVNNALGGAAQLCVVSVYVSSGTCAEGGAWGRPNAVSTHGTFVPQPIVAPDLPEGQYRILADNGDGEDDPDDVVSEPFTVSPCVPAEGRDCSTAIARSTMDAWKQTAAESHTGMKAFCLASSVYKSSSATSVGSALVSDGWRDVLMADIKGEGVEVGFSRGSSVRKSLSLLRTISCGAMLMYADIVADPPDPDYKHVDEPPHEVLAYSVGEDANVAAAAQTLEDARAQGVAHRIGIERYQGAVQASDAGWAAAHADRVGDQALATQAAMRRLGRELRAAAVSVADPEIDAATTDDVASARAIRERVRVTGFTEGELADLRALGLSAGDIEDVRAQLGAPLPADVAPLSPDVAMQRAADHVDKAVCVDETDLCGFDQLGRTAGAVGGNARIPPTIAVQSLTIREGDVGVNHARALVELSHPTPNVSNGSLAVTPRTTADGEVAIPSDDWLIGAWETRTRRSVTITNDLAAEDDETAHVSASTFDGHTVSPNATVTIVDDDGSGDPPSRPRAQRGLLAMWAGGSGGSAVYLSEPDGTELTRAFATTFLESKKITAWSPDGRWLLAQHMAPTLSALEISGEPVYRLRITEDGALTGDPALLIEGKPYPVAPTFSADGRRMVLSQFRDSLYKLAVIPFDTRTGTAGAVHVTGDDPALDGWWAGHGASFNPDRTRIAFAGCRPGFSECGLYVVPVDDRGGATDAPSAVRIAPANTLGFPSWSPDGRLLAYLETQDGATGVRTQRVSAGGQPVAAERWAWRSSPYWMGSLPAWAPDSRSVAFEVPADPMLPPGYGGATLVVDVDGDGAAVGAPRSVGLTGWAPHSVWGMLPDDTPPETTATVSPKAGEDGVHRAAVTVSLRATDNRGVTELEYSVDGAGTTVRGDRASVTLDRSGSYSIRFRARDANGNIEREKQRTVRVDIAAPPAPGPEPATAAAPVSATAPALAPAAVPRPAGVAELPSNRRCLSRRRFVIRLREPEGEPLKRAVVYVGKRRMKVIAGRRLRAAVDLRRLPKGRFTVRVVGTTRSGKQIISERTYRTCAKKTVKRKVRRRAR